MGATQEKWIGNQLIFYDGTTFETLDIIGAARKQIEDFEGAAYDSNKWLYADKNEATQGLDGLSHAVFMLTSDATQQEAGIINQGNILAWDISKGLIIEFRVALTVLPTLLAETHIGILGQSQTDDNQIAEADDIAEHACFVIDGSGTNSAPLIYTDDGTNENNAIATGVTLVAGTNNIFRIEFTDDADIKFYIDGAQVGIGTTFAMDDIASPLVQPYVNLTKSGGAGLGTITLDYIKIWQATR